MRNAINTEMSSINEYLIISNCLSTCSGIKHEKHNVALNSTLEESIILTKIINKQIKDDQTN